jgi:hypothetical protein
VWGSSLAAVARIRKHDGTAAEEITVNTHEISIDCAYVGREIGGSLKRKWRNESCWEGDREWGKERGGRWRKGTKKAGVLKIKEEEGN